MKSYRTNCGPTCNLKMFRDVPFYWWNIGAPTLGEPLLTPRIPRTQAVEFAVGRSRLWEQIFSHPFDVGEHAFGGNFF